MFCRVLKRGAVRRLHYRLEVKKRAASAALYEDQHGLNLIIALEGFFALLGNGGQEHDY